ncbi:scabin-related ADP-ribosyltransferase [Streptomyces sp. H27-D2]|uniref:scabin-related ADP-ribosyltransferase n=1 Tax=Streptomyces sp. H27-D2 TaxID=3046304 RepID=UPI003FA7D239
MGWNERSRVPRSDVPQHAKGKTWVYEISNPGPGIRVNKVLPWSYVFRAEREIIFPNGIDPSMITKARRWEWGQPTGEVIENSGRRPNG